MPEELTTRDVFQQVDVRLSRVEEDLRDFRTEMNRRFERLWGEMSQLRGEMHTTFRWTVGLMLVTWLSVMGSIWLK